MVFVVLYPSMNFYVSDIKHKNNRRKQAWSRVRTSNAMVFILNLVPVPATQILHPDCDLKTMPTLNGSLWGNIHGAPVFFFLGNC